MSTMYDIKPCPFTGNCEQETAACSLEESGTCPVIVKPPPKPAKEWNPLEPVAVTLTKEQWRDVRWKLEWCMNVSKAKAIEYADHPAHAFFAESAAQHEAEAENVAGLLEEIKKQLGLAE